MNFALPEKEPFTLQAVADANGVSLSTVWRWTSRGVSGARLETYRKGGRRFVHRRALEEFDRALNSQQTYCDNAAEVDSVDEELEAEGL